MESDTSVRGGTESGAESVPEWFRIAHSLLPQPNRADRGERTPWAMSIVLEIPKSERPSRTALLRSAAMAVVAVCLDPQASQPDSVYREGLTSWYGARIRKLTRRARNVSWRRVQSAPGATVEVNGAKARALVPTPVDAPYPEVARLQISGTELPYDAPLPGSGPADGIIGEDTEAVVKSTSNAVNPCEFEDQAALVPVLWVDRNLNMSVGKVAAQVGHGSMLYAATLSAEEAWRWRQMDFELQVREVPRELWPEQQDRVLEVRDAGFTEIAPGSITVAVTRS